MTEAARLEELRRLLERRSIRRGEFTLASGAKSDYYCDTKAAVLSPRGARLIGELLHARLVASRVEAVGGLAMGAAYLATAVAVASDEGGSPVFAFTVRRETKGHGTGAAIDESFHPDGRPLLCPGRRVGIVEDVVTSGGSILRAVDAVAARGCEIVTAVVVVDRQAGGRERLAERGLALNALLVADRQGRLTAPGS